MPADILASLRGCAKNRVAAHADGLELERFELCAAAEEGPLYDCFVAAWAASSSVNKMEIGFHGTPERNVAPILREGLDPRRRRGQAFGAELNKGELEGLEARLQLCSRYGPRVGAGFAGQPMGLPSWDFSGELIRGSRPSSERSLCSRACPGRS